MLSALQKSIYIKRTLCPLGYIQFIFSGEYRDGQRRSCTFSQELHCREFFILFQSSLHCTVHCNDVHIRGPNLFSKFIFKLFLVVNKSALYGAPFWYYPSGKSCFRAKKKLPPYKESYFGARSYKGAVLVLDLIENRKRFKIRYNLYFKFQWKCGLPHEHLGTSLNFSGVVQT